LTPITQSVKKISVSKYCFTLKQAIVTE